MLETLISSRIRRTLFEYILTHSGDRFYLRGLAKTLNLSVSPLRRELKRLEQSGVLRPDQEGNMVFYTVNIASPMFQQLRQAGAGPQTEAPSLVETQAAAQGSRLKALGEGVPLEPSASSLERSSIWRNPLSGPVLLGAASVGITLVFIVVGLVYLNMTNQRLVTQAARALAMRGKGDVTVVMSQPASSSAMRGSRWQVVPGGFGGFSTGAGEESY